VNASVKGSGAISSDEDGGPRTFDAGKMKWLVLLAKGYVAVAPKGMGKLERYFHVE
jgi:hypothetical protein